MYNFTGENDKCASKGVFYHDIGLPCAYREIVDSVTNLMFGLKWRGIVIRIERLNKLPNDCVSEGTCILKVRWGNYTIIYLFFPQTL